MAFSSANTLRALPMRGAIIGECEAAARQSELLPPPAIPFQADATAFRQLRHQTKNALQRVICEISRSKDLQSTEETCRFFVEMERRICLTARISDALFGLTTAPGTIQQRLQALATDMAKLFCEHDQTITCNVMVEGRCPDSIADTIVRIAHEMIGNAIKHGLTGRSSGEITVRLLAAGARIRLQVLDDGPGTGIPCSKIVGSRGEGMPVMRELARSLGGCVTLVRYGTRTEAEFSMPQFPASKPGKVTGHRQAV